jgi:hypothetical protein
MASSQKIYAFEKLKGAENYVTWALRMEACLTKLGLEDALESANNDTEKCQKKALAEIKLWVEDGPLHQIKGIDTAFQAWERYKELYHSEGFTSKYLLLKEYFNCRLENFDSVEKYLNKVKESINDLKS